LKIREANKKHQWEDDDDDEDATVLQDDPNGEFMEAEHYSLLKLYQSTSL
jgi:hypothetical protein